MTEQNIPDVTEDDRRIAREWAGFINSNTILANLEMRAAARVILNAVPTPPRPTLADMAPEEWDACQWMQCDAGPYGRRGLIINTGEWDVYVADEETGAYSNYSPDLVTARPDLPRMEWNGTDQEVEDVAPVKIGDEIESAADPRIAALPDGSVLLDREGEATAKRNHSWRGAGYMPVPSQGVEFGPWTVLHIPKEEI